MTNTALRFLALLALCSQSGAAFALDGAKEQRPKEREVVVGCTSTVAYDPGGCERAARKKCKGEARFMKVLASTPLATSGIHSISARYTCGPWTQ